MQDVFHSKAELKYIVCGRGIDDGDGCREVLMIPMALCGDGVFELCGSELTETIGLVFD